MIKFKDIKIIAEIGLAHDGSYALAASYIHKAKKAGADCVKFQTHIADAESSVYDEFRVKSKFFDDKTRKSYWERTSFQKEQWIKLKNLTEKLGMFFLSSPFSIEAAKMLNAINVKAWKVGSGELTNFSLLDYLAKTNKPIILSTGLSNYKEISQALKIIKRNNTNIVLMQCTSLYPCPPELIGLNVIEEMKKRFKVKVGFSDHSGDPGVAIAAFSLGASIIETHVCFDKDIQTFDSSSSLNFEEFYLISKTIKKLQIVLKNNFDKSQIISKLKKNKILFEKSIYLKKNMTKNSIINFKDMIFKKPAIGIHAKYYKKIIGKKLKKNVILNQPLKDKDVF
jgi:N,N'-diacetyllegionaminate synthase